MHDNDPEVHMRGIHLYSITHYGPTVAREGETP